MSGSDDRARAVGALLEGDGKVLEGVCGAAREYFESHAVYRLVWNNIRRSFAESSHPVVEWESAERAVLVWRAATDGTVMQRVRVADFRFDDGLLSGFSVDGMPLPWVVRSFRSVDSDHVAWVLVWRPGGPLEFLVVDRAVQPVGKGFPDRVSGHILEEQQFATIDTSFGQLAPTELLWFARRGTPWLSHFMSPVSGLGPLSVQRFVARDSGGVVHEFVPVGPEFDMDDVPDGDVAHGLMLLNVSLVGDARYVLPGSESACPWTLGRRFSMTAVDADAKAVFEMRDLAASWRSKVIRRRHLDASDPGVDLREIESGFEVVFGGDEVRWTAPHMANLLSLMTFVFRQFAVHRIVVDAAD